MIRARACQALGLLVTLFSTGCLGGLFEPATPERPPEQNCASDFTGDYFSPTGVLQTLSGAMQRKARGRCAYLAAFADSAAHRFSYRATFPQELITEREAIDLEVPVWQRDKEAVFYDDFMELADGTYALTWSPFPEAGSDRQDGADSTLFRRYQITPAGGAEILAAGTVAITFRRLTNGQWVIALWDDRTDRRRLDPDRGIDETALLDMTISQRRLEAFDANF